MLLNVLLILLPLVIGYLVPLSSTRLIKLINQSLGKMVYLILFLMGLGLAYVENLGSNLAVIFPPVVGSSTRRSGSPSTPVAGPAVPAVRHAAGDPLVASGRFAAPCWLSQAAGSKKSPFVPP